MVPPASSGWKQRKTDWHPLQTPGCSECVQKWFGCGQELHSQNPPEAKWPIVQEAIQNFRSTPPLYQANSGWMAKIGGSQEIKSTLTTEAFFMYWKAKARDSKLCRTSENSTRTTTLTSTPWRKLLNASAVLAGLIAGFPKWFLQMKPDEGSQKFMAFRIPSKGQYHWITSPKAYLATQPVFKGWWRASSGISRMFWSTGLHQLPGCTHRHVWEASHPHEVLVRLHKNHLKINLEKCV